MCLLLCPVCEERLTVENHICDMEKVRTRVTKLVADFAKLHSEHTRLQDKILFLVSGINCLDGEETKVKTGTIRELYELAQMASGSMGRFKSADSFLSVWIAMHGVLSASLRLFRVNRPYKSSLELLYQRTIAAGNKFGYNDTPELNTDQIIKKLIEEDQK